MGILQDIFGGGKKNDPMNAANSYLNQIPGVGHAGYDPYVNAGLDASNKTKSKYEELFSDPVAFLNKIMGGYKTSEGYNFEKDALTKELSNTAAAGGVAGTPMDQLNQGEAVQGLLSKDMQQFLMNALGIQKTGLEGEEGIAGRGFDASKNLTDLLGGSLNQQGGLAFQGQQQKNQNKADLWKMFGKALGGAAGFALGGPLGAGLGAGLGGNVMPMSGSKYAPWSDPG